ncbi:hypothetical protein L1887_35180 [Cichorium endivia]|nr:hypothetical protein L1887_35180 [Cichorium endivia]
MNIGFWKTAFQQFSTLPALDSDKQTPAAEQPGDSDEIICNGKESCKEYIKNLLAAILIRELQANIKKWLFSSTPLHHRLQIEFPYTQSAPLPAVTDGLKTATSPPVTEVVTQRKNEF